MTDHLHPVAGYYTRTSSPPPCAHVYGRAPPHSSSALLADLRLLRNKAASSPLLVCSVLSFSLLMATLLLSVGHPARLAEPSHPSSLLSPGFNAALAVAAEGDELSRKLQLLAAYLGRPPAQQDTASSESTRFGLVTATRFWCSEPAELERLSAFIASAVQYSDAVLIALNVERDRCSTAAFFAASPHAAALHVLPMLPWLSVTAALNSLTLYAARMRSPLVLFQSVEVTASVQAVQTLRRHLTSSTICVGLCLPHQSCEAVGDAAMTGTNNPWNTLALWHVDSLLRTGFLSVSDSRGAGDDEGQEEGPTLSVLQMLTWNQRQRIAGRESSGVDETRWEAKLLRLRSSSAAVQWAEVAGDERRLYVERKLQSKRRRFDAQMQRLTIRPGVVTVVFDNDDEAG